MSVKKEHKDRKEAGIAAKTCRAKGLAKAERTKSAKRIMEKLSESNPSYRDYRLKLAFEFAPGLAHVYVSLRSLRSIAAISVSISQTSMFSHPTFLRLLGLFAAIPVLS
jgi:hypothetical protein